ncbi:DNA-binding transcriptional regulator [Streptomyces sp. JJ36]|uniref:helix-turn-helix domain-containing protein n=1 Tax=Streptomyces sp. JJ36 TaxID=2736645 RepID=UPI001F387E2E|nr:helix-turn-helix transcriptional regulator [Streptomyces sp. JJ36]MCF6524544.1 helix-turn-helix transcriptional regulator [Streptomyces sp. JJ36]
MDSGRDGDGVAALLAEAKLAAAFDDPQERARLRKAAGLSLEQVARAVGVGRQTVANWESGAMPSPQARGRYLRLLEGLAQIHPPGGAAGSAPTPATGPPAPEAVPADAGPRTGAAPEPPGHATGTGAAVPPPGQAPHTESPAARAARAGHARHRARRRTTSADQVRSELRETLHAAVEQELQRAGGDADAATTALVKRAIPDVMTFFARTRAGARYEYTAYPALPGILRKPSRTDPDLIWEGRPSWRHPAYRRHPDGDLQVTALDVNAAYLSAMKAWLPIGKLTHSSEGVHDRKRSGVHLITPPAWPHSELPSPLGDREEGGPLWVTDATLRLLLRLSGPKHRLIDPPVIHESWTSAATETFLDGLRRLLAAARADALAAGDDVTAAYVKAMYAKFVSTLGESSHNREMMRPDWMHLIRSQAFANLWSRAHKAHQAGLTVVSALGTDELHVAGDWRQVWSEGRDLAQMKVKTDRDGRPVTYTVTRNA